MDNNDSTKPQQTGGLKLMTVFIAVLALHVFVIGGFTVYHLMGSGSNDADLAIDKTHKLKADGTPITDATANDKTADATGTTTASTDAATTTGTTTPSTPAPTATAATTVATTMPAPAPVAVNPPVTPAPTANGTEEPSNTAKPSPVVLSSDDMVRSAIAPALLPPPDAISASNVHVGAPMANPAPAVTPAPAIAEAAPVINAVPAPKMTPAFVPAPSLAPATSGPIITENTAPPGPVHMPKVAPKPAPSTSYASSEEHAVTSVHPTKKETYTVKMTDSYKKIALAHHVTVAQLKEANHITDNVLHTGQKLIIPAAKNSLAKSSGTPPVGTPSRAVLNDTASTAVLSASPATLTSEHHHHTYTVAKGDTLSKIAKMFNVSTTALEQANNLTATNLSIGEKLKIPSKTTHVATARVEQAPSAATVVPEPAQPSQVEAQPAPIAPVEQPVPVEPAAAQPSPASNPELANLTVLVAG